MSATPYAEAAVSTDAEDLLSSLMGIVSAHIVADDLGEPTEIHILAAPDLHPKRVVRNVESALCAGLGLEVDRRIISVARMRDDQPAPAAQDETRSAPHLPRLEFVRYSASREAMRECACEVVLRAGGTELVGRATGADTLGGRAETAAAAVFDALARLRPGTLVLEGAVIVESRGERYVVVAAAGVEGRHPVPLAGAARLTRSPEEAAILACLQATNRWNQVGLTGP